MWVVGNNNNEAGLTVNVDVSIWAVVCVTNASKSDRLLWAVVWCGLVSDFLVI